jgi:hypothetical protein
MKFVLTSSIFHNVTQYTGTNMVPDDCELTIYGLMTVTLTRTFYLLAAYVSSETIATKGTAWLTHKWHLCEAVTYI